MRMKKRKRKSLHLIKLGKGRAVVLIVGVVAREETGCGAYGQPEF